MFICVFGICGIRLFRLLLSNRRLEVAWLLLWFVLLCLSILRFRRGIMFLRCVCIGLSLLRFGVLVCGVLLFRLVVCSSLLLLSSVGRCGSGFV